MLRRIAIAMAAAAVLAAGYFFVVRDRDRTERAARAETRLPAFDDRQVTGLTLAMPAATWRVSREGASWRVISPVEDAADAKTVEAVIAAARRTRVLQTIDKPEGLASYGLEPPALTVSLAGVTTPALAIGNLAPTGEAVYARVAERPGVLMLAMPDAAPLLADPSGLRDRAIVELARSEITGIEIEPGGVRLAKAPEGWWLESPRRAPASASQVDKLLGALYAAKAVEWDDAGAVSDPRYGLGDGAMRIVLRASGASRAIRLGADAGGGRRYVAVEGRKPILLAQPAPLAAAAIDAETVRENRLTNVNRYAVTKLSYGDGRATFAATRKDETTWTTDAGAEIQSDVVLALLVKVLEAPTKGWSDGTPTGAPSATLTYTVEGGGEGRVAFYGTRAAWDALPGALAEVASPPPAVPRL